MVDSRRVTLRLGNKPASAASKSYDHAVTGVQAVESRGFDERMMLEDAVLSDGFHEVRHGLSTLYDDILDWLDLLVLLSNVDSGHHPDWREVHPKFAQLLGLLQKREGIWLGASSTVVGPNSSRPGVIEGNSGWILEVTEESLRDNLGGRFQDRLIREGLPPREAALVEGAFVEMCNNAHEHSRSVFPPLAAWTIEPSLEGWGFAVADVGIGVRASLVDNPALPRFLTDTDALLAAIRPGVTCTGRPDRGGGFDAVFKALVDRRARLWFRTGAVGAFWEGSSPTHQRISTLEGSPRSGFYLSVRGSIRKSCSLV